MTTIFTALLALPIILYLPGLFVTLALFGSGRPGDLLARHYERITLSTLLSGWLAFLLAELGIFSLLLLLLLLLLLCLPPALVAWRYGRLPLRQPLGIVAPTWPQVYGNQQSAQKLERSNAQTLATQTLKRSNAQTLATQTLKRADAQTFRRSNAQTLAYLAVLALGALLVARPFEVVLGGRDAGVYASTGFAIARTGGIVQHDALLAELAQARAAGDPYAAQAYTNFFSSQNPERFIATRLRAAGFFVNEGDASRGRVVPQFFHLYPVWIAIFTTIFGLHGGLAATGFLATLALWSVMMLGRTLAGPWVGLLGGLLLSLNGVQVWFGRYSTSEATAQFLTFAALYAFAHWQSAAQNTERETQNTEHRAQSAERRTQNAERARSEPRVCAASLTLYATLTAIAAGQLALTRIDFFLVSGPIALYLVYCALSRRWTQAHSAALLGLTLVALHAALHIAFIARAYFFDTAFARLQDYALSAYLALPFQTEVLKEIYYGTTRSQLKDPLNLVRELAILATLLLAALAIYRFPQPLYAAERLLCRLQRPLSALVAVAILLLGAYAYLLRPQILNADVLFNTRGGWGDPLTRDPAILRDEAQRGITGIVQARADYGVVFVPVTVDLAETTRLRATLQLGKIEGQRDPFAVAADVNSGKVAPPGARTVYGVAVSPLLVDTAATSTLRKQMLEARGSWSGPFSNQTPNWLRLQGYIGAPVSIPPGSDPRYTVALANMVRVGWYLSPLGVALAVIGMALWVGRGTNRRSWLFLVVALLASIFYIRQSYGTSDQTYIYILRRFMPVVYPAACLASAYAVVASARLQIATHFNIQKLLRLSLAGLLAAALVVFLLVTNQKIYRHTEYAGAIDQIGGLAARFEPNAIVIFRGGGTSYIEIRDVPEMLMTPLRFGFGVDALVVKSEQPGKYATDLAAQIRRWQSQGRPVYLALSSNGGSFSLPGVALTPFGSFELALAEFEQLSAQKPHNVDRLLLPFTLYRVAPAGTPALPGAASVGARDFAGQLRGFYRPETGAGFVWTNDDAVLRLATRPASTPTLSLRLAGGKRPAILGPAVVCVSAAPETVPWQGGVKARPDDPAFVELGCLTLSEQPADYRLPLDPALLSTANLLIRLQAVPEGWIPAQSDPALRDQRILGLQLYQATLR